MKVKINNIDEFCEALKEGYVVEKGDFRLFLNGAFFYFEDISYGYGQTIFLDECYYEKPDQLKIECGKYYKTRAGKKALVEFYKTTRNGAFIGQIEDVEGVCSWDQRGLDWNDIENDLVSPWEED